MAGNSSPPEAHHWCEPWDSAPYRSDDGGWGPLENKWQCIRLSTIQDPCCLLFRAVCCFELSDGRSTLQLYKYYCPHSSHGSCRIMTGKRGRKPNGRSSQARIQRLPGKKGYFDTLQPSAAMNPPMQAQNSHLRRDYKVGTAGASANTRSQSQDLYAAPRCGSFPRPPLSLSTKLQAVSNLSWLATPLRVPARPIRAK